jgi:hypothetical protein
MSLIGFDLEFKGRLRGYIAAMVLMMGFMNPLIGQVSSPNELSPEAEISILTVGPGTALYDRFGHSAFRVKDSVNNIDWTFNYGTYDFNAPNFYGKFVQGQLLYALSAGYFQGFINYYKKQNRSVRQQVLNLDSEQKARLFSFLMWNARPENKDYRYDFFYDNCATRIRDVLVSNLGNQLNYTAGFDPAPMSFRQLIQAQVPFNDWGSVGMDIAIGAVVDVPATPWQFQFLPKYVAQAHGAATIENSEGTQPLISSESMLFDPLSNHESVGRNDTMSSNTVALAASADTEEPAESHVGVLGFLTSPLFFMSLIGLSLVLISWRDYKRANRCALTDRIIWGVTGFIGILLVLLWFGTDHLATKMNYNLLWAMPTSLVVWLLSFNKSSLRWLSNYQLFLILMLVLMIMHQFTGVQSFAPTLWPFIAGLLVRFIYSRSALKKEISIIS